MPENIERYGGYGSETGQDEDGESSVGDVLRRHYVATRIVLAELLLFGLATVVIFSTDGPLGNVVYAILVSVAVLLAVVSGAFGGLVKLQRWRRT